MSSRIKTILLWSLLSFLVSAPFVYRRGLDVVTKTYHGAAVSVAAKGDPYLAVQEGGDLFKYSPLFAVLYRPLSALPEKAEVLLWALVNIVVFWWALSLWAGASLAWSRKNLWLLAFAVLASMELDISLRYQQFNPCLAGLTLMAFFFFREKRFVGAGLLLALATNLKILPGLFALALARFFGRSYGLAFVLGTVLCVLLPSLILGWSFNQDLHFSWLRLLISDAHAPGLLDLSTQMGRWGWPFAAPVKISLALITLGVVLYRPAASLGALYSFGAAALLLLSPRTESPTFVLMAPAYVLLALEFRRDRAGRFAWALLSLIAVLTTLVYTDLWPRFLWSPAGTGYASKTLGALGLWGLALTRLVRAKNLPQHVG